MSWPGTALTPMRRFPWPACSGMRRRVRSSTAASCTRETPEPVGGQIVRGANGEPTGPAEARPAGRRGVGRQQPERPSAGNLQPAVSQWLLCHPGRLHRLCELHPRQAVADAASVEGAEDHAGRGWPMAGDDRRRRLHSARHSGRGHGGTARPLHRNLRPTSRRLGGQEHYTAAVEAVHFAVSQVIREAGGHDSDYVGVELKYGW
jgi:hypothetical protein